MEYWENIFYLIGNYFLSDVMMLHNRTKNNRKNGMCPNIFLPQFCIDAWIIYKNHLESLNLDEPRTGGGLR